MWIILSILPFFVATRYRLCVCACVFMYTHTLSRVMYLTDCMFPVCFFTSGVFFVLSNVFQSALSQHSFFPPSVEFSLHMKSFMSCRWVTMSIEHITVCNRLWPFGTVTLLKESTLFISGGLSCYIYVMDKRRSWAVLFTKGRGSHLSGAALWQWRSLGSKCLLMIAHYQISMCSCLFSFCWKTMASSV